MLLGISDEAVRLLANPLTDCVQIPRRGCLMYPEDLETAARSRLPDREQRLQYRTEIDGQVRTILDIDLAPLDPRLTNASGRSKTSPTPPSAGGAVHRGCDHGGSIPPTWPTAHANQRDRLHPAGISGL